MAASQRTTAATTVIVMILSLLVAVNLFGADARPAVRPGKTAAALSGADVRRTEGNKLTVGSDEHGLGYVAAGVAPDDKLVKTECDDDDDGEDGEGSNDNEGQLGGSSSGSSESGGSSSMNPPPPPPPATSAGTESELDQELCSDCEEPKKPEPKCNTCEEPKEAEKTCNKVHAVREGESCDSVVQCAGLSQEDFLSFNPNLCCEKIFVGQWICLDATCAA